MAEPDIFEWASSDITQTVQDPDDTATTVDIDNKTEPVTEWKTNGILYNVNTPYPYVNYAFNLIANWITNLQSRAGGKVGDIEITTDAGATITTYADIHGGTWLSLGSDTLAATTVYVFERTV